MRRSILAAAATAALATTAILTAASPASAERSGFYTVPKTPRTVALPKRSRVTVPAARAAFVAGAKPGGRVLYKEPVFTAGPHYDGVYGRGGAKPRGRVVYRDPVYGGGLVHPGFYGGFNRYGAILPRSGNDTDVDVDVRQRGGNASVLNFVPRARPDLTKEVAALRAENWRLRRSLVPDLGPLGLAATAKGDGGAELRELLGAITARRERQYQERVSGARVVSVDEYQRELGIERTAVRRLEGRERNPHILYLGFAD